jgi:hypothetical protein
LRLLTLLFSGLFLSYGCFASGYYEPSDRSTEESQSDMETRYGAVSQDPDENSRHSPVSKFFKDRVVVPTATVWSVFVIYRVLSKCLHLLGCPGIIAYPISFCCGSASLPELINIISLLYDKAPGTCEAVCRLFLSTT